MLDKILSLFERLVMALETTAAAAKVMAEGATIREMSQLGNVTIELHPKDESAPATPAQQPPAAQAPAAQAPATPAQQPPAAQAPATAPAPSWDPFTAPVVGRYGQDKQFIMDAMLTERGIDPASKRTGQEKHVALLEWAKEDAAAQAQDTSVPPATPATATQAPSPAPAAPAPAAPAAPVTLTECRALASQAVAAGHTTEAVTAVWKQANGGVKPKDTPEELLPTVKAALLGLMGGGQAETPAAEGWD